ncbi:MAG: c-type cytochrome [Woeseiaceae bacterium]
MKTFVNALVAIFGVIVGGPVTAQDQGSYDAGTYATCAACHLPDGAGIPGAFPRIRSRATAIAQLEGGRDYLITVTSYGLMGNITVDAAQYFGIMPGNSAAMSAAEIASVLNYIVFELSDTEATGIDEFTTEEVESVQSGVASKSPATAGEIRKALTTTHGDGWP